MSQSRTLYVGMDVHKESIAVFLLASTCVPRLSPSAPSGLAVCYRSAYPAAAVESQALGFVYEAGPCGYWLSRSMMKQGDVCWVVAPIVMPKTAGFTSLIAQRDAMQLAGLCALGPPPTEPPTCWLQSAYPPFTLPEAARWFVLSGSTTLRGRHWSLALRPLHQHVEALVHSHCLPGPLSYEDGLKPRMHKLVATPPGALPLLIQAPPMAERRAHSVFHDQLINSQLHPKP